jgi:hypothetical protein
MPRKTRRASERDAAAGRSTARRRLWAPDECDITLDWATTDEDEGADASPVSPHPAAQVEPPSPQVVPEAMPASSDDDVIVVKMEDSSDDDTVLMEPPALSNDAAAAAAAAAAAPATKPTLPALPSGPATATATATATDDLKTRQMIVMDDVCTDLSAALQDELDDLVDYEAYMHVKKLELAAIVYDRINAAFDKLKAQLPTQ